MNQSSGWHCIRRNSLSHPPHRKPSGRTGVGEWNAHASLVAAPAGAATRKYSWGILCKDGNRAEEEGLGGQERDQQRLEAAAGATREALECAAVVELVGG